MFADYDPDEVFNETGIQMTRLAASHMDSTEFNLWEGGSSVLRGDRLQTDLLIDNLKTDRFTCPGQFVVIANFAPTVPVGLSLFIEYDVEFLFPGLESIGIPVVPTVVLENPAWGSAPNNQCPGSFPSSTTIMNLPSNSAMVKDIQNPQGIMNGLLVYTTATGAIQIELRDLASAGCYRVSIFNDAGVTSGGSAGQVASIVAVGDAKTSSSSYQTGQSTSSLGCYIEYYIGLKTVGDLVKCYNGSTSVWPTTAEFTRIVLDYLDSDPSKASNF